MWSMVTKRLTQITPPAATPDQHCGAPDHALNSYKDRIWILIDSRSSIQYLKNWPKNMDSTGLDILSKLARLGQRNKYVSSGFHHMWVCLGTKLLMSWLVGDVISLTPVPLS
ncbi:hypothetical protein TNCV_3584191 [Trichonephila clavipes]|nr:hypothetical protein TNCV_3584191 [Trichonephila clavipes]